MYNTKTKQLQYINTVKQTKAKTYLLNNNIFFYHNFQFLFLRFIFSDNYLESLIVKNEFHSKIIRELSFCINSDFLIPTYLQRYSLTSIYYLRRHV